MPCQCDMSEAWVARPSRHFDKECASRRVPPKRPRRPTGSGGGSTPKLSGGPSRQSRGQDCIEVCAARLAIQCLVTVIVPAAVRMIHGRPHTSSRRNAEEAVWGRKLWMLSRVGSPRHGPRRRRSDNWASSHSRATHTIGAGCVLMSCIGALCGLRLRLPWGADHSRCGVSPEVRRPAGLMALM